MRDTWAKIKKLAKQSNKKIHVLDGDYETGKKECNELHIPLDSVLGTIVLHSNGLMIDNWIRIFGQDSSLCNGVFHYNRENNYIKEISGMFLVASDVVGGLFAININRFPHKRNMVWYFAPDTLEWECIELKYSEFVEWSFQDLTDEFYSTMRWTGWKNDVKNISMDNAIQIYPFLWAEECNLEKASKKPIKLDEMIELNFDLSNQLGISQ